MYKRQVFTGLTAYLYHEKIYNEQKQNGDKKQTADKQEQKAEGDTGGQKKQQDPIIIT